MCSDTLVPLIENIASNLKGVQGYIILSDSTEKIR